MQGRDDEAIAEYGKEREASDLPARGRVRLAAHAVEQLAQARPDEAESQAREVLAEATAIGDDVAICVALGAMFAIAWLRSDYEEAVRLSERAVAHASRDPELTDIGVEGLLAMALAAAGRTDQARDVIRRGLTISESRGTVGNVPRLLMELARIEYRSGRWDDAVAQGEAALQTAGAAWDVARAEAALRAMGAPRGRRFRHAPAKTGWDALTETERRVVALAAEGLTNRGIGNRLYLSGRTAERHLTHVYAKLGIASRVELAALAVSRN